MNGIFHVHTRYSHDGKCTLSELAGFCRKSALGFIVLSEHAEDFNPEKMRSFVSECEEVSRTSGIILSAGLEFGFKEYPHLHLLGIGLNEYIRPLQISETIDEIHRQGGLAVVAHPTRNRHFVPDHVKGKIDGIEVWNAAYDSRYFPHHGSIRLLNDIKKTHKSALAFGGLDMHRVGDFKGLTLSVNRSPSDNSGLIELLRDGSFTISGKLLNIGARQRLGFFTRTGIRAARLALEGVDALVSITLVRWRKAAR